MALESVSIRDFFGSEKKITTDTHDTDKEAQVLKMGFGAEDATPTLVSTTNPMPTASRQTTTKTNVAVTVTTTQGELVAANATRVRVDIINLGSDLIYLGFDTPTLTTANGYPLWPGREKIIIEYTGPIHAIASTGSQDVRVMELG